MQTRKHVIAITLIASMAMGGVVLGMESNPRYNTGEALQKLWSNTKIPTSSISDYQKSQKDTQKKEREMKKQDLYSWYETQKQQIQSNAELAKKALSEKIAGLSEKEKASQKELLYAQYKQLNTEVDTKINALKAQKEAKLKALETQYVGILSTDIKVKSEPSANIEAKKKELNTRYETQKKQLTSSFEEQKAYLYSKRNAMSDEEKKTQNAIFEEKKKSIVSEFELKKKTLQAEMEAKMKEIKAQYENTSGTKPKDSISQNSEKEKTRDMLKEKLGKLQGDSSTDLKDTAQCKAVYDTLRNAKEANSKERQVAWNAFRETNKGIKKDIFVTDSREDVRDTLDGMRLQIRLVERKYTKGLIGTSSTITLDYALSSIDAIVNRTRTDLAEFVQQGKSDQFITFRDGFVAVMKSNKKSLLTILQSQAQVIKGLGDICKKKAESTLLIQDSSDRQVQGQLQSNFQGSSTTGK